MCYYTTVSLYTLVFTVIMTGGGRERGVVVSLDWCAENAGAATMLVLMSMYMMLVYGPERRGGCYFYK